ncbi:MAG: PAS domain S-box protein [Candidatus Riflebacteria bacterium]|nr:PAS domain S-box protein [Candidatus Riflebacteria bacterium]
MSIDSSSHELILLVISLAQIDNPDRITALFVEALERLFVPAHFEFRKTDAAEPAGGIPAQTIHQNYGWMVVSDDSSLTEKQHGLIRNAVQMLAMIIECNEHKRLLSADRDRLKSLVEEQTAQMRQKNDELRETNKQLQEEVIRHRQTADELRESEEIFTTFLEHNPAYVFFKDEQLRALKLSRNYEQMLGRPLSEILGKTMDELFPTELAEPMIAADQKILREGKPIAIEEHFNGNYYSTVKFPISIAGKPNHLAGFTIDITRLKSAEEELRKAKEIAEESEIRFKALHNASFGGIAIHDKGKILDCNQGLSGITGYSFEELVGMDCLLLISEKTRDMVMSKIMSGYEKPYEAIGRRKNGEEFPLRLEAREIPYRGKQARTVEFRDITEQKQAEAILAAEKERLAVTLRSIGDGVITTDTKGNVILMNKIAEDLTGWLQLEAQGQPLEKIFKIVHENSRKPCENPVEKVISTGNIIEQANHTLLISRNGTERVIADSGAPIKDMNSTTIGVVLVFRDMTDKQKLLDSLQRTDKLEAIGVLAGGIAHDFNNLLTGIFGYIELARSTTDTKKAATYLEQAMVVFGRAKNLTQQLLAFAKGGAPLRKTGDLGPVVRESAIFALSGSAVTCDFKIAENLWNADFDKSQIEQTIDNLVINAQQAMPSGGRITISAQNITLKDGDNSLLKPGNYIKISIEDAGIGMPADILKRVFDPFFTTKQKGNGLGLTTCYATIQKHAGTIDVESVMGKGSTFHIFIPASQKALTDSKTTLPKTPQGHGQILIMDDEPFVRDIVSKLLKSMGYSVVEAKDGEEAVKLIIDAGPEKPTIDAAIFDLTIPGGMGGKDAIVHVRKKFPDLPVIASSGYSEDPVIAQPKNFGFTDSLRKPYRKEELATMLNRYINKPSSS